MKRVIEGKMYNTETADCVASWTNGESTSDFHYCAEYLYRKKRGEFFLYGEGHAFTKYAKNYGNNSTGFGCKITPMTEGEARCWAEKRCSGEEYEEIFGTVEE